MMKRVMLGLCTAGLLAGCASMGMGNGGESALALHPVNPQGLRQMSVSELRANLVNSTFVREGTRTFAARVHNNYEISGKAFGGDAGIAVGEGRWVIKNGNDFCTNWHGSFGQDDLTCFKVYRAGRQIVFQTEDGMGMSASLVAGNPYAL